MLLTKASLNLRFARHLHQQLPSRALPWRQITDLSLNGHIDVTGEVLDALTSLERLVIPDLGGSPRAHTVVNLPSLHTLEVRLGRPWILGDLHAPKLQKLVVTAISTGSPSSAPPIPPLSTVAHLTLRDFYNFENTGHRCSGKL